MTNNDVLKSLRYMLKINDQKIIDIIKNCNQVRTIDVIASFMKKEEEEGYQLCDAKTLGYFLDGLIIHKRGKDDSRPPMPLELPLTNNHILKKLKIAFALKDDDIIEILKSATFNLSKAEVSALLRKSDHPNYRPCGDQVLRYFLKGLTSKIYS